MNKDILGKKIKQMRVERGLSQEKLSEMIDISPRQMCVIENGNSSPSLETFVKIARVLEIDVNDFLDLKSKGYDDLRLSVINLVKASDKKNLKLIKDIITTIENNR